MTDAQRLFLDGFRMGTEAAAELLAERFRTASMNIRDLSIKETDPLRRCELQGRAAGYELAAERAMALTSADIVRPDLEVVQ